MKIETQLPDITRHSSDHLNSPLQWVGMEKIGLPVTLKLSDGSLVATSAMVDIFVNLAADVKGIHMSRLYLQLNEQFAHKVLTHERLEHLMGTLLDSHKDISDSAKVVFSFDLPINKKALKSGLSGYQSYSFVITHQRCREKTTSWVEYTIPYSSTCPCSSALANQLIGESIAQEFPDEKVKKSELLSWITSKSNALATPHNQRSYAYIKMQVSQCQLGTLDQLIWQFEHVIGTPVQTAVKREDEQEFAKRNGANLLFCEDAAKRIKSFMESATFIIDYWFKIEHQESLHAHNAVVIDQKIK
ncbi:GTP cyclohydrolase I FolE2 [Alteromonas sp. 5E99-2]|uniref:GTP cyclohydrolase FolE2 n=1 Tax=Alteromonas sp. 5E99-2 TaxID=2817683 RepID=UPI001A99695E|nr:GTP cyclohydrolase FolE2 [Alteromonas sp. 5E99-2]MBO1254360.1 GTP cyclohydrolase I FolE2 [Alteromonas sp. 5E99-2]